MKRNILRNIMLLAAFCAGMNMGWGQETTTYPLSTSELATRIANQAQITDLPTIYLTISSLSNINDFKKTDGYRDASIKLVGSSEPMADFDDNVQIKVRGNSTQWLNKRPYRLKFAKDEKDVDGNVLISHKHDLLGLGYSKRNWVLLANAFDHSMIRNALTYHLGQYVGLPYNPGYKFVDLVINGYYRGVYQISDQVEADKKRVNVNEDTGWMIEFQGRGDMLDEPYITGNGLQINIKNPDYDDYTTDEWTNIENEFKQYFLTDWLSSFNKPMSSTGGGWRAFNDEETFLRFYLATEITGDYDGLMTVKAYKEADEQKLCYGPLWDKDLAYGNYGDYDETLVVNISNSSSVSENIKKMQKDPKFTKRISEFIDSLIDAGLKEKLCSDIDDIANVLDKAQKQNFSVWPINQSAPGGWAAENYLFSDYATHVSTLKEWLCNRIDFVQLKLKEMSDAANVKKTGITTYNPEATWFSNEKISSNEMDCYSDVKVINRSLTGGAWNTFCMPFDATEAQIKAALGGIDFELATHTGMDIDGSTMLFGTLTDKNIIAGYPYLIKPASNVNSMTFTDVIVSESADNSLGFNGYGVSFDNLHYFYGTIYRGYNVSTTTDYLFENDIYTDNSGFSNTIKYGDNSYCEKGSRAFIRVPEGESPAISFSATELPTIVIDMSSTENQLAAYNGNTVTMRFSGRGNLYADGWCTICLPFTMTKKNFEAAIGMETKLREVDTATGSIINFKKLTDDAVTGKKVMYAGVPYLIMIDPDVAPQTTASVVDLDEITFENVKIEATEGVSVDAGSGYAYVGTLKATTLATDGTNMFLGAADKLYKPYADASKNSPLSGGKAYFVIPANTSNVKMVIDGKDEDFSAIKNVEVANADGQVYNLNGQVVKMKLNELPHGIYIVNGKKFVK